MFAWQFGVGYGDEIAARRMWQKVNHHKIKFVCTDRNYSYGAVLPRKIQHIISKKELALLNLKTQIYGTIFRVYAGKRRLMQRAERH